ncbi:MAG: hypothetical protein KAS32_24760 [Candidatus Peribacteraceae bacterium]|nr:hypothetical protein [Candidatus Peribacteraceae bacterium]
MSEQDPNFKNVVPNGYCPKCRMAQIRADGVTICPSCDTGNEPKTGHKSNVADPGHDAFNADGSIKKDVKPKIVRAEKMIETDSMAIVENTLPSIDTALSLLDNLDQLLSNQTFKDLREAKAILKLRRKILNLKTDVQLLLG